ncbi:Tetratricopeptide repeat protein 30B [Trichinella britovi]|uniref:Tetratricopeptide repeat protein 30 n=1 Tax=Trichinella britovi TaxID=45882 RepID=A0A0V1D742_TRIBR|nr:Tetratricopeptide repeat protein 30B [Trichinella britovi]
MQFIEDGDKTKTIYTLIKDGHYSDVIPLLTFQLTINNNNRAALSLLAYCYWQIQAFSSAAECYRQLTLLYPNHEKYRLYLAQCYYHSYMLDEAMTAAGKIKNNELLHSAMQLQAAIKYAADDLISARILVQQSSQEDTGTQINWGCLCFKEEDYPAALEHFLNAMNREGSQPDLMYNLALCYYKIKQYAPALHYIAEIIESGIKNHPELSIGMAAEGLDVHSVGNTWTLHRTALVEAFNLKAAIEYKLKNYSEAAETLSDMPPRKEEDIDAITLHNNALLNMDSNPVEGFAKLQFLLQQTYFPPETFSNLLLLYCKYEYFHVAADVMAENAHLTYKYLTQYMYDFMDAIITQQASPEESFYKFDNMIQQQSEILRKLTKRIQNSQNSNSEESTRKAIAAFDESLELYLPVLMAQAKIYWDQADYIQVEKIFQKSVEFCSEHELWKLNVAHTLFMQEGKFKEAAGFYEPIVKKFFDRILDASPIVLANLCVCYILINQNEEAEELMRKVEKEEDKLVLSDPNAKPIHLSIINLVIGTLYCSKGNYEFGISRVIKALEPYSKKLSSHTWLYAKRCFLSMIENLVKHVLQIRDSILKECMIFFENCEEYGKFEPSFKGNALEHKNVTDCKKTIGYEARLLNALLKNYINS